MSNPKDNRVKYGIICHSANPLWRNFCKSSRKIKLFRLQELSRTGFTNMVNGKKAFCHDEIVEVACKNQDNDALASSPIDIVTAAGFVMVPKV